MQGKRILVTGASGFIGKHLCAALAKAGAQVVGIGRGESAPDALKDPLVQWVQCDLAVRESVVSALPVIGKVDVVFHAAGNLAESRELDTLRDRYFADVVAPMLFLDRGEDTPGQVVFFSTAAVYGPSESAVDEASELAPSGLYGTNKAVLEDALGLFGRVRKCAVTCLRVSAVFGPGMPAGNAISRFMECVRAGDVPQITGPPNALRDYVYIADVIQAALDVAGKDIGGTFNIASGAPVGLAELARLVGSALDREVAPEVLSDATGADKVFRIEKARQAFGFAPVGVLEGLKLMVQAEGR